MQLAASGAPLPPPRLRSPGGSKPATLETGATMQVPLFVNSGDKIKIDTRTDTYLNRA